MSWKNQVDNNDTKTLIAESLRHLMQTKSFDSIRIKNICDEVGVVRVTFYNYFIDKYDALDYLIYLDLIEPNEEIIKNDRILPLVHEMVKTIYEKKDFYKKAIQIEGQNGFVEQLELNLSNTFKRMLDRFRKPSTISFEIPNDDAADMLARLFVFACKKFLFNYESVIYDDFIRFVDDIVAKPLMLLMNS